MFNRTYSKDLTTGSLFKGIFFYGLPLIFSNLLQVFFNITDLAVVGRYAGAYPLGSVGSTSQLIFLFTGFLIGIGGGVNVTIAYYIGARNKKNLDDSVHTAFFISLFLGLFLLLIGFIFANPVLVLIKTKEELLLDAVKYFKIYMLAMPGVAIYNYGNAVLSAAGDTKRPLYFLIIAGIVNVGLNLLFVIVFKMSCTGVALASVISQYLSAILVFNCLVKGIGDIKFSLKKININPSIARKLLRIGIPSGMQNAIFALANTFIQVGVNSFDAVMVAGTAASSNLDNIVYNAMNGFYIACATFIGQNYGGGKKDRIRKSIIISNGYAFILGGLLSLIIFIFGKEILSIFTNDTEVINAGMTRLKIMCFSYPFASFMDNTIAANRGLGKTFVPSLIVLAGSCLFRILWVLTIFAYFRTITSLFLLYIFSWIITAIAEIIYFIFIYKKI